MSDHCDCHSILLQLVMVVDSQLIKNQKKNSPLRRPSSTATIVDIVVVVGGQDDCFGKKKLNFQGPTFDPAVSAEPQV